MIPYLTRRLTYYKVNYNLVSNLQHGSRLSKTTLSALKCSLVWLSFWTLLSQSYNRLESDPFASSTFLITTTSLATLERYITISYFLFQFLNSYSISHYGVYKFIYNLYKFTLTIISQRDHNLSKIT